MDLLDIRTLIVVSVVSDDLLMDRLVLKGGNALEIVHRIGERASLDLDFSMTDDFEDVEEVRRRLFAALRDRFDSAGLVVFDEKLEPRPRGQGERALWGGYTATFKLIAKDRYRALGGFPGAPPVGRILEALRRESLVSGPGHQRVFTIEISKFEYCEGRVLTTVEDYDCYVYTPAMIAVEKLRAICQQMPEYSRRRNPVPRPRDFYDIHAIVTFTGCDLAAPEQLDLLWNMFRVKEVPVALITRIPKVEVRDFHRQGWPAVENAVRGRIEPFDVYFDFVVKETARLPLSKLGTGT